MERPSWLGDAMGTSCKRMGKATAQGGARKGRGRGRRRHVNEERNDDESA